LVRGGIDVFGSALLLLYVAGTLALGYWGLRRTRGVGGFFLGDRSIGPWMSAFAYGTTYFSAVLFVGYAGKLAWGFGHYTLWIVAGNTVVGSLLAWLVLARRTRELTVQLGAMTWIPRSLCSLGMTVDRRHPCDRVGAHTPIRLQDAVYCQLANSPTSKHERSSEDWYNQVITSRC
jgi:hypothetical protein